MDRLSRSLKHVPWAWCIALGTFTPWIIPATAQAAPTEISAEHRKEAEHRYKRALELFNEGSYDASLLEFKRAYELAPTYRLLYNIALVNVQLNDHAGALAAFESYLEEGGAEIGARRRDEVEKEIEHLRQRVAYVTIHVDEEGSEIRVDDFPVGTSPLSDRIAVNAGRRRIVVMHEGRDQARVIEVAGGDVVELTFELAQPEEDAPPPHLTEVEAAPAERSVPWVAWGVTGALAAGTVTTGILALNARSQQAEQKDRFGVTPGDLDRAAAKVRTFSLMTDVLLGATLLSGGVSLYLTLKEPKDEKTPTAHTKLIVLPTGLAAHVSF